MISPTISHLFEANDVKLIKEMRKDLDRWEILPRTLTGTIETVRMNILPRLLFVFRSLLIMIPSSTFKILYKNILKFLWQNKSQNKIQDASLSEREGRAECAQFKKVLLGSATWNCNYVDN